MSRLLIATDEAGYGPKLGPLVIAATAWELDTVEFHDLDELFSPLRVPHSCDGTKVVVDDSKAVFKPAQGLSSLHAVVSAAVHWSGQYSGQSDSMLTDWLANVADTDMRSILETPWFDSLDDQRFLATDQTRSLLQHWQQTGLRLRDVRSRILTAKQFNSLCSSRYNKADLLSESTVGLVRSMVESYESDRSVVTVYCDRHGGRRYYGSVLQHAFPDSQLQVMVESKQLSRYRLTQPNRSIEIAFTVKGDSFTPVAFSSMVAKYLRERLMNSLNRYFSVRHQGSIPLKPTAGYPVDADRFLQEIGPIIETEEISTETLVRSR